LGIEPFQPGWPVPTDLYFMEAGPFVWKGVPLGISRSGYTGEDGFEISVPAEHVEALADALCAPPEVKPIGLGARDSLRLEAGLPLYGHDMDPSRDPVEANAAFAISKRRRLRDMRHHKLVGFHVDGRMPVREGAFIYAEGRTEIAGTITSGGFAPSLNAPIAMGYLDWNYQDGKMPLVAVVRGKSIPITVTPMPFIPHNYHRRGASK
jgi:aminomethyltransferase